MASRAEKNFARSLVNTPGPTVTALLAVLRPGARPWRASDAACRRPSRLSNRKLLRGLRYRPHGRLPRDQGEPAEGVQGRAQDDGGRRGRLRLARRLPGGRVREVALPEARRLMPPRMRAPPDRRKSPPPVAASGGLQVVLHKGNQYA